jgi:hypothetical protein
MRKILSFLFILCIGVKSFSQIEAIYFFPKGEDKFTIGFGASIKFSKPVSDAAAVTIDIAADFAAITQSDFTQGVVVIPVKLGYRYTLNKEGYGFYVEPQVGYNVYGILSNDAGDTKFNGIELAGGIGYLFESKKRSQYDIGLRYETSLYKGSSFNFIGLKLSHSFSFGRASE